jgi:hypothetical protein
MSNLRDWAMRQINSLEVTDEKKEQYKKVLDTFCEQGHSGVSAVYALAFIRDYVEKGYDIVKEQLDTMLVKLVDDESKDRFDMQYEITNDILNIIGLFREYGFGKDEANKLRRLMDWKPIIPLTGSEDEWNDVSSYVGPRSKIQQNKVCSAVFRDNFDNSTAYYIYGRVYSDNGGHSWFTTGGKQLQSSIPVTFPFEVPDKPEYIYLNGEDSTEIITDEARIKELYDEWEKKYNEVQNG